MKPIHAITVLALSLCSMTIDSEKPRLSENTRFSDELNVFQQVKGLDKPVMIFMWPDTLKSLSLLDNIFNNAEVANILNKTFVCKRLDAGSPLQAMQADKLGIINAPCCAFYNAKGELKYVSTQLFDPGQFLNEIKNALRLIKEDKATPLVQVVANAK